MDYPYVRFNTRLDKLDYSNEEYASFISPLSPSDMNSTKQWSRQEDDELARVAFVYDLRWPVWAERDDDDDDDDDDVKHTHTHTHGALKCVAAYFTEHTLIHTHTLTTFIQR
jgi:hypothetical protein